LFSLCSLSSVKSLFLQFNNVHIANFQPIFKNSGPPNQFNPLWIPGLLPKRFVIHYKSNDFLLSPNTCSTIIANEPWLHNHALIVLIIDLQTKLPAANAHSFGFSDQLPTERNEASLHRRVSLPPMVLQVLDSLFLNCYHFPRNFGT
jgi:hypothetical protein